MSPAKSEYLSDDPHKITERSQIFLLLERLSNDHSLVNVALPETTECHINSILAVDEKQGRFELDEFRSRTAHQVVTKGAKLVIQAKIDEIPFILSAEVLEIKRRGRFAVYVMAVPETAHFEQRRQQYRFHITHDTRIRVELEDLEGELYQGELTDISVSGLRIYLPDSTLPELAPGSQLTRCTLSLPENISLSSRLELRYTGDPSASFQAVGGRFVDLDPAARRVLRRFTAGLAREQARRKARIADRSTKK